MPNAVNKGVEGRFMDMAVYERLNQDDVQTLGYFPAEKGVLVLALIGG